MTSNDDTVSSVEPSLADRNVIEGRIRIDENSAALARRIEPGDIAVIDQSDLDRATAYLLMAAQPSAVLNAAPSTTGRYPNLGPSVLLEAGIPLIDNLGSDVMTLREGQVATIRNHEVWSNGILVAEGQPMSYQGDEQARRDALSGVRAQFESFASSTADYLERESDVLTQGKGIPNLREEFKSRPVVLVSGIESSPLELKGLRSWIKDTNPVFIGVDAGADVLLRAHIRPDIIVGDMETPSEKALTSKALLVVRGNHDGTAPGRERLVRYGLEHKFFVASGTSEDVAILLAVFNDAQVIVTVGSQFGLADFLDRGRKGMAAAFLTRLRAGDLLVSSHAVTATYRPRIRGIWLLLLCVAALATAGAALGTTPWGHDIFMNAFGWVTGLFGMQGFAG